MNKVYGLRKDFATLREDTSRWIVSYGMEPAADEDYATWHEIYIYKSQHPDTPSAEEMKDAIINDIDAHTDEKILTGFVWQDIPVWLSTENQFNFKAAYDLAVQTAGASLPVTFKLGEDGDGKPMYHEFTTLEEFTGFYTSAIAYVNQCLNEGWQKKDAIDGGESNE